MSKPTKAEIKRAARRVCKKYILSGCRGCRLDTRDMPCTDTMCRRPISQGWSGPRDPERCAELLRLKGASR